MEHPRTDFDNVDLSTIDGTTAFLIAPFYKELKSLTLNRCMIPFNKLKTMYSTVKSLQSLKITGGYKETSLNTDVFDKSMKTLTQFSFRGGSINSIGLDISKYAPSLQVLNLDGNNFTQLPTRALMKLGYVTSISLLNSPIENLDNITVSQLEKYLPKLQILNMDKIQCSCATFYSKLRAWMIQIKNLGTVQCVTPFSLQSQLINEISKESFCSAETSTQRSLSTTPPSHIFSCNMTVGQKMDYEAHMKYCLCTENNNGMKTFTCQNTSSKVIINELYYLSSPFDKWNIHELILVNVDLSTIDGTTAFLTAPFYKGLKSLTLNRCMIPFNKLKTMYSTVKSLESLTIIGSYNETSLNTDIFDKSLKNLTQFSFRGGSINYIGLDISSYAPNLQVLNLDWNNFTQFPIEALKKLGHLTTISLMNNPIANLDNVTFSQVEKYFPKLQTLNINCIVSNRFCFLFHF
ncbi:hypothetical protein GQR58_012523 [Nymphon striatum]|nr:hypothetical protein GQR58_012523 [Nymphon striatum]